MSNFYELPDLRPLNNAKRFALLQSHSYDIGHVGSGNTISVPAGFITDLTSVPRLFLSVFPRWGRYVNASIIHDWLYWQQNVSRKYADQILLEAALAAQTDKRVAYVMYYLLRLGGWYAWRRNKKKKLTGELRVIDV